MRPQKYTLAATEVLLIFPAALFMAALFLRNVQPLQYEPAHAAQQIVNWYAGRPQIGLWAFLIALPLTVLVTGGATLFRRWSDDSELREAAQRTLAALRAHLATVMISGATLAAGGILAIVALHLVTD
jgi:ABC-type Fe3+ transport system permease subunit